MAFLRICGMISNKISDKTNSRRKKGTVPFLRVSVGRRGAGLRWRPLHTEVCRSTDRADRRDRRPLRFAQACHSERSEESPMAERKFDTRVGTDILGRAQGFSSLLRAMNPSVTRKVRATR